MVVTGVPARPSPVLPVTIPTLQSVLSPELLLIAVSLTFAVGKLRCATRSASVGQVTKKASLQCFCNLE
jgi:hypothetical protein